MFSSLFIRRAAMACLTICAAVGAQAGFNFFTSQYSATREELQTQLVQHFPLERRYGNLFNVTLHDPQLGLDAANNRIGITTGVTIQSPLLQTAQGVLTVSSALRYDPASHSLLLEHPNADRIELQGLNQTDAQNLQNIGAAVAQALLEGQPLHTFRPEELRMGWKTYEIGEIKVNANGVTVQLK
ncbi:MAG: DUF1439 domain-containing protein [Burkholderiaceae bacterium]|jgi:hypothetical protein|nr:DUF1439 domain-containing protein [Burkholderiaceae bacterium]